MVKLTLVGAHASSAVKRCSLFMFAHNHNLKINNKREMIDEEGTMKFHKKVFRCKGIITHVIFM